MGNLVGIDVGGTCIKGARYSSGGDVLARAQAATPAGADVATAVRAMAGRLRDEHTVAAAVVVPGVVDRAAGVVRWSANLDWRDVPLRAQLVSDLGLPVVLDNDVAAAGLAEYDATGADLLYVGLGTGIGSCSVTGGVVLRGATGLAGELGHVPVRPDGETCACGQLGCLEVYASAAAIARRYVALGGRSGATSADVAAAREVDPIAAAVWGDAVEALGRGLATATLLLDPERIVLGGGLAAAGQALATPVRAALAARLLWRTTPPVSVSVLGLDAGTRGAALLAGQLAGEVAGQVDTASVGPA